MQRTQTQWLVIVLVALGGLVLGLLLGALVGGITGYALGRGISPLAEQPAEEAPPVPTLLPEVRVFPWRWPFCPPCPEVIPGPLPEEIPAPPGMFGARVERVMPNTPAEEAGLRTGDVIVAVNRDPVTSGRSLADLIARYRPGDEVTLTVRRGNETLELRVRLGEHPERPGQAYLGIYFTPSRP